MKYEFINKSIETDSGAEAECWTVTGIWIDLKTGCAVINLEGYKNFELKLAGKKYLGTKEVRVDGINALSVFSSVHDTIVSVILNNENFSGGTLAQVEV